MKRPVPGWRLILAACLALLLALAACGPAPTPAPEPTAVKPENTPLPDGTVTASAVVVPGQQAKLAFLISGAVKEVAVSVGDPVATGQKLVELSAPDLEYAVLQAEDAARAAELRYQYWIPARLDRPPERRQLAEQEYIKVQRSLDTAKAVLTQATINAPFDGIVADIQAVQGEQVQPGQIMMTLADLEHLQVETTDLSERDLPKVQVGQAAQVFVEALDQSLPGRVTSISPAADKLGGDVIYKVTVELDSIPSALRWGMTAEVHIQTQ